MQAFLTLPLSDGDKRKILWDNCARLYQIAEVPHPCPDSQKSGTFNQGRYDTETHVYFESLGPRQTPVEMLPAT